jgi:DNA-binding NarL/FixJ family response regulator
MGTTIMHEKTTVLIADDHPLFRKGLRDCINEKKELVLVGEAENGKAAWEMIEKLRPHVAVIDIEMPVMNGLDLIKLVHDKQVTVSIVILTMYKDPDLFDMAMDLGAKGYVLKDSAIHDIVESIQTVSSGQYYISPMLSTYLINRDERQKEFTNKYPAIILLTATEKKIMKMIADNKTSKEIAKELFISDKTVDNHRTNIAKKLNLHGSHQLLKFALENKAFF